MKSAEQQIREMLGRAGVENPETYSAGDLVELANLIAEIAKQRVMRKQLEDWNKELVEALEYADKFGLFNDEFISELIFSKRHSIRKLKEAYDKVRGK